MKTSDFDYDLPVEYIAQHPVEPRDTSRLMVLHRKTGKIEHTVFRNITAYLQSGDVLVLNQTRVIPARLFGSKIPGRGKIELLLLKKETDVVWETLVGGKGLYAGRRLILEDGPEGEVIEVLDGPRRKVRFSEPIEGYLYGKGKIPLPPYITQPLQDPERYQTVYAQESGSVAAPTAGLHFTPELLQDLRASGIQVATATLHIGLDTFAPVTEPAPGEHHIHTEWCQLTAQAAEQINRASVQGGRIVAVGTTSVRTLESAAKTAAPSTRVGIYRGPTDLFILPGYRFRAVDVMVTNFHLPRSTLIMLVSAFASREGILAAYELAKREGYRFYSFGDAMLII